MKEVREQQAQEKKVVEAIKSKMDRIRAKQQKLRGTEVVDPQTHFQGNESLSLLHRFDAIAGKIDLA